MSNRRIIYGTLLLFAGSIALHAQEFKIGRESVQVHGFGTQGFIHTDDNNWLTMNTSSVGSGAFTDLGLNLSTQIRPNLRIAAQAYDRKLGALGDWHPALDWGLIDFRLKPWLGFRGGRVKTVLGLFNDTQDADFANTFALLPQSIYPIDLRDSMIAHEGGDIYGKERLPHSLGTVSYTAYGGRRSDSMHSGYPYLLASFGIYLKSLAGPVFGGDLRWMTPWRGMVLGASRQNEIITAKGTGVPFGGTGTVVLPYTEYSKHDWTNQFYGQYTANRWHAESEYRRYLRDQIIANGTLESISDVRGWYVSGGFRVFKWLEGGSYYSHYRDGYPTPRSANDAAYRDYDKVVTAKFTINQYLTLKVEEHFMAGYGNQPYPNGFYGTENPRGFKDNTNALVVRSGFSF